MIFDAFNIIRPFRYRSYH